MAHKKTGFAKKVTKNDHLQCGCKEIVNLIKSGRGVGATGGKCECTIISSKTGFKKSKKGGIKQFKFNSIDIGRDSTIG